MVAVCYRELFTDDVIRTEGIRVELSQLATKHLNTPSNGLVTVRGMRINSTKEKQEKMRNKWEILNVNWGILLAKHKS